MRRVHALVAFALLAIACASAPGGDLPARIAQLPQARVEILTRTGVHRFEVWIAADDQSRERGLMHVHGLPPERGMLFLFAQPQYAAFWMKDTWISLDMVFIGPDGAVVNVAEATRPHSLEAVESDGPVVAVLEVRAGTARRIALAPGDQVVLPTLRTTAAPAKPSVSESSVRTPQ